MVDVLKRSGKKEDFDPDKLKRSIQKAMIDAKLEMDKKGDEIQQIWKKTLEKAKRDSEVKSLQLRNWILDEMDKIEKSASDAWRDFDKKYKSMTK